MNEQLRIFPKIRQIPEKNPNVNKFLDHITHEGHRGTILAIHKNQKQAIIRSLTNGFDGIVKSDKLYLIQEIETNEYLQTVKELKKIPKNKFWSGVQI